MKRLLTILLLLLAVKSFAQQKPDEAMLLDYYQNQRFAEAADYLKKIYPEPVTDKKALSALAYTSSMAGRLPDAENYYQRVYQLDTTNTGALFNLGNINMRRGNNAKALIYYKRIAAADSTNFAVYKQLATLSQSTGDVTGMLVYLQKANKLNPQEPDVAYNLASLMITLKQFPHAAKILDTAIVADTSNMLLQQGLAQVDYQLKKYPETIAVCTKLVANGEKSNAIVSWLAISNYMLKKYQECIDAYALLGDDMQNETSFYYTGMAYKALNKQKEAIIYFDKATKDAISAYVNDYYAEMADSFDKLHLTKKAIAAYQRSLYFKEDGLVFYSLANIYDDQLKDKRSAVKYYRKYLASNPDTLKQKTYVTYSKSRIGQLKN